MVEEITGLKSTRASTLIKLLVDSEVIVPVTMRVRGMWGDMLMEQTDYVLQGKEEYVTMI